MTEQFDSIYPPDEHNTLDDGERLGLTEEIEDARYRKQLEDRFANYSTLRKLKPLSPDNSLVADNLVSPKDLDPLGTRNRILTMKDWVLVEGGYVRVMEVPYIPSREDDSNGYLEVRPTKHPAHQVTLRVWYGIPNTAIIMPRTDAPLPRSGKGKDLLLEQMKIITGKELDEYTVWIERLKDVPQK